MKKYLITILFILSMGTAAYAYDDLSQDPAFAGLDFENESHYFQPSSSIVDPEVRDASKRRRLEDYDDGYDSSANDDSSLKKLKDGEMPFFKKCRLILTNQAHKLIPSDTYQYNPPELSDEDDEDDELLDNEQPKKKSFKDRFKFGKKKKQAEQSDEQLSEGGTIADTIKSEIEKQESENDELSLATGISEHVTQKELTLDAPFVNFDEESGDIVATGRPVLYAPPQKTRVVADKMIYNQNSNILRAIGNVVVTKDGVPTKTDYLEIDMNEESITADNVESLTDLMIVDAEKAIQQNDTLILLNGNFHSDKSQIYKLSSRMIGPRFQNLIVDDQDMGLFFGGPEGNKIRLDIDRIYVNAGKNHDKFTLKKVRFYRKDKYWFTWPSITAYADKDREYFEANYPEFGSRSKLGTFIGPGVTFGGPWGSIIKVIPFLNYQNGKFGFGGALKYHNKFNHTELGYGSSANIFFLRGNQRLDDNLFLQYASNSYTNEWFLGSRMAKYMAQIVYDKGYSKPNFLGEYKNLSFRHRASFGLMQDNDSNYYGERYKSGGTTTTRLRYMAQINQTLYDYQDIDKRLYVKFSWLMQGSAALYGTGDTQFVARTGPKLHVQYKNWMQDLGYYQSGYSDNTPMRRYDAYRYGHSSVYLSEVLRINKYLSVGWSGNVNLSNDAPNGRLFQENRFVVAIGPDDLRVRIGYDFVRRSTYFGFDVAFDTKGTRINYGRMEIKNPERFGKKEKPERTLSFVPAPKVEPEPVKGISIFSKPEQAKPKVKPLEYAQVIPIEDPDKETTD